VEFASKRTYSKKESKKNLTY